MRKRRFPYVKNTVMAVIALLFISPVYMMFVYSFKSQQDIMKTGISFPATLKLDNFVNAVKTSGLGLAMYNSLVSTICMTIITIVASAMAAYMIARKSNGFYGSMYYTFLAAIILPFQVIMLPMYLVLKKLSLMNTLPGYVLAMTALQLSFSIFIMTGFVKSVPKELDESAYMDGAGKHRTFWLIVFPLLRPIVMTTVILNALALWNDLIVAMIVLQKTQLRTLTLAQYMFISQYSTDLGKAFAVFTLSIIPIVALYFMLQKYIIQGIAAGAVKG